ncbi:RNA polymerase sigma factor [Phocaeicola barnesiae]|jgi:RNA polymerase sigma-70 factor (ECF subfamily)|uniref:RNA polymerase sigma factor n=1 Tax=Phocaeicola barnesiae TaxID=376804 RepID=UPI000365395F|nr:sigma-70 family RNA polymerase sigma factor [Phocaeicola barnesiae]MBS6469788.1 sigma-70 family RNA polymerase sigma factor [Bacteroides sp.]MCF2597357.1 sigma-70 family RNA polymerase sigma factor [Phocaeicola barnesiae]MDM8233687.1 sigma-70 family RNA polymerase sigma factor [Phocaeicola barnesiae]MDM8242367.1 sigma-70 family RNA polymerase sigma factor [Phocaeicola barnesiae]MDM8251539.1 sigma-70 family RNA polymerase sigma factor [Phocaeicola barnesiae]
MKTEEQHKIERILAGKTEEFAYFLDTYGQQVFTLIVRMTGSESDAEELTQDTFLKAFQHLSSFNGKSQFSTWIYRIAYNTALTALRKKNIELTADEKLWNTLSDTETDDLLDDTSENRIEKLREALDRLPADERALITFFYEEEKNISEIAVITGQTEGNVKVKLYRLRKKLAAWMQEED